MPRHTTRPRTAAPREIPEPSTLTDGQRARRDRIVDAAVAAMTTTEYADISVKSIADEADVALGTLYRYFNSKDHLMACALVAWAAGFGERPPARAEAPDDSRVAAVFRRAARAFEREPSVLETLLHVQASPDPHAAAAFAVFVARQRSAFDAPLEGAPADARNDITAIMSAVLSEALRSCHAGSCTRAEVYRRIDRAAELLTAGAAVSGSMATG